MTSMVFGVALVLGLTTGSVAAAESTFVNGSAEVKNNGDLRVTVKVADVTAGHILLITHAQATAVYGCRNKEGNTPKRYDAPPVSATVYSQSLWPTPNQRGVVNETMIVPAPAGGAPCPAGLKSVLVAVQYQYVLIADGFSGHGLALPGTFSRKF